MANVKQLKKEVAKLAKFRQAVALAAWDAAAVPAAFLATAKAGIAAIDAKLTNQTADTLKAINAPQRVIRGAGNRQASAHRVDVGRIAGDALQWTGLSIGEYQGEKTGQAVMAMICLVDAKGNVSPLPAKVNGVESRLPLIAFRPYNPKAEAEAEAEAEPLQTMTSAEAAEAAERIVAEGAPPTEAEAEAGAEAEAEAEAEAAEAEAATESAPDA